MELENSFTYFKSVLKLLLMNYINLLIDVLFITPNIEHDRITLLNEDDVSYSPGSIKNRL